MQNYDVLLDKIAGASGVSREEIERKVEAKKAKLSGLISREGAAQIIAAELGVSFEDQDSKVNELVPGMRKVNVVAKIIQLFPVREYEKNGRSGKVANFRIADETGNCRVVLWDTNHIALIESGDLIEGSVVSIKNGSMRDTEIHLSGFSEIQKSSTEIGEVKMQNEAKEATIDSLANGQAVQVRGVIVQMFPARFYSVCPECNKKAMTEGETFKCLEHGDITPKKRGILNFVLDDGTESVRCVLFSDAINKLTNEEELEDTQKFEALKSDLLGTEMFVSGNVRKNALFQNLELIANDVEKVDVEALVAQLEG